MAYVDGFVLAVPKQRLEDYKAMAPRAGEVWKEDGALAYVECIGDDVPYGKLTSFPRAVQANDDEIVVFSWIVYETREQRDAIVAKVMADPRLKPNMSGMPFEALSQKRGSSGRPGGGRLPAWISSPTDGIASRRRSSSTRSGFISGSH